MFFSSIKQMLIEAMQILRIKTTCNEKSNFSQNQTILKLGGHAEWLQLKHAMSKYIPLITVWQECCIVQLTPVKL